MMLDTLLVDTQAKRAAFVGVGEHVNRSDEDWVAFLCIFKRFKNWPSLQLCRP